MRLATLCVALAAATAGCLLPTTDDAPADDPADGDGATSLPAPAWDVGDWWVHRSLGPTGEDRGLVRTEVVAVDVVDGRKLYRVRITGNFTDSPLLRHFDEDLNGVWFKWGDPCGPLSRGRTLPCDSGDHWFEWPLRDGATWHVFEGGDVIEGAVATAARATHGPQAGPPAFGITFRDNVTSGLPARYVVMSPEHGWHTLDVRYDDDGRVLGASVLVDSAYPVVNE